MSTAGHPKRRPAGRIGPTVLVALALVGCKSSRSSHPALAVSEPMQADGLPHGINLPTSSESPLTRTEPLASNAGTAGAPASVEDADGAADTIPGHRHYPHGGLTMFIAMSLDTLAVAVEKRAQMKHIQYELDTSVEPVQGAERSLVSTLADGVSNGKVDVGAVNAALAHLKSVAAAACGTSVEVVSELHAALTPAERVALVDRIDGRREAWRRANVANPLGVGVGADEPRAVVRLERFAGGEFGLTSDQLEKIRAGLRATAGTSPDESDTGLASDMDTRLRKFRAAFVGDSFDAKAIACGDGWDAHLATAGPTRMARFFEVAASVLTFDQRAELAAHLRDRYGNFEAL
jgi:Spy/CpxP family protein refolding chaperone